MSQKDDNQRKKKESIVDLAHFVDKKVCVKFQGGREATGILKGYDALLNMVLDQAIEHLRDSDQAGGNTKRNLGLIVARGTAVTVVAPADGLEQIENPFANPDE